MRGSAASRTGVAPGGALAGPWVSNPLWSAARAVPSLDLRFAESKSLTDAASGQSLVTFTRASSGTYVGSDGLLKTATTNEPRFDHNPTTGESLGLLVEEQRTNLLLLSGNLYETGTGAGSWVYQSGTMSDNTQVAPDGTTTADTLTTTGGALSIYQSATVTASTTYTGSAYVRLGTMQASDFKVAVYNNSTPGFIAVDVAPSQTPTSSGWTRISYSFTTPAGCTSVRWYPFRNSAGIGSCTVHLWGAQLEAGAFPTSYIPTTTATATRNADVASITGTNFSSWYRQDEGTVFADVSVFSASKTNQTISFNDGTSNNRWEARSTGIADVLRATCTVENVLQFDTNLALTGLRRILAMSIKPGDSRIQSGASGATLASFAAMPVVDRLYLNYATFANGEINGTIRRLTYWPARLPNTTLQQLTQ